MTPLKCITRIHLHHDLKTVKTASLFELDLAQEALNKVLVDNTVACSKECKNVLNEDFLRVLCW